MKYYVEYNTGVPADEYASLSDACAAADAGAAYTQRDIDIYDESGLHVMTRRWCGVEYDELDETRYCEDPICFGSYGYYTDWFDMSNLGRYRQGDRD